MKKIVPVLFLVCAFSVSATSLTLQTNCTDYAMQSAMEEFDHYDMPYTDGEFLEAAMWYYKYCENTGGNVAPPVFADDAM